MADEVGSCSMLFQLLAQGPGILLLHEIVVLRTIPNAHSLSFLGVSRDLKFLQAGFGHIRKKFQMFI